MKSNDMQAALRAFLDANPDLPEGESAETPDDASTATPAFRLDIILEKKGVAAANRLLSYQGGRTPTRHCSTLPPR